MTLAQSVTAAGVGTAIRVVCFIDVPLGNNAVGTAWRDAVVAHCNQTRGNTTSRVEAALLEATLPGTQAKLDTGELYEFEFLHPDDGSLPEAQRLTNLQAAINTEAAAEQSRMASLVRYVGHTLTIADPT